MSVTKKQAFDNINAALYGEAIPTITELDALDAMSGGIGGMQEAIEATAEAAEEAGEAVSKPRCLTATFTYASMATDTVSIVMLGRVAFIDISINPIETSGLTEFIIPCDVPFTGVYIGVACCVETSSSGGMIDDSQVVLVRYTDDGIKIEIDHRGSNTSGTRLSMTAVFPIDAEEYDIDVDNTEEE